MSRLLSLLLLFVLSSPSLTTATPLLLDPSRPMIDASGYLERLEEHGISLDATGAAGAEGWQPLLGNLNAGYTAQGQWLRLTLQVDRPLPGRWMLRLGNALLDDVQVYRQRGDGWELLGHSGENVPRGRWPVDYRSAVVPFEPEVPGPQVLLLRLQSKNAMVTRLEIWQRLAFDNHSRRENLNFGLYFGFYLLLVGLHLLFWLATRTPLSGLFFAYLGLSLLNEVLSLGLIQQLSGLPVFWSDRLLGAGFACNLLVGFRMSMHVLRLPSLYPRPSRWLDQLMKGVALVCLLPALAGHYAWSLIPVQWLALALIVGFSSVCAILLWQGYRHARFFALAFGIFYVGLLTGMARNLGHLPLNAWTEHASAQATMLHMLLLSLWLIGRHERKRRARERRQANLSAMLARDQSLRLERQVEQRTAALRQEIQRRELLEQELRNALELEQRVRTEQQDFVAMVSHEFRTPLAIITTLSQRIEQSAPPQSLKNVERCLRIRSAATRLLALVDEYLSDDRMSESAIELKHAPYDLAALLEELSGDFAPGRIRNRYQWVPQGLVSDAGLLHIALRNLLANADRHSSANEAVDVVVNEEGEFLLIDICNVSTSIPAHERERLFRKYFRGQSAKLAPGAGLGLYLVRRISEMLGGDVTLLSAGGEQGVCFRLRLPKKPVEVISD